MREEFEKLAAAGKITHKHLPALLRLVECGFCQHRSWGFGQIKQVDTVFGRFQIDFPGKPDHSMDLAFAAESLRPIPRDHILARKALALDAVREMAALHHLELIRLVLQSFGGRATVDQIQQVLVPDVISSDWRKWWDAAKHEMKTDGHFHLPTKKTEPIVYQAAEVSLKDRLMRDFNAARGLKARLATANELLKNLGDVPDKTAAVQEAVTLLNIEIQSHQRTLPALALEAIWMRDDLRTAAGLPASEGDLDEAAVWAQVDHLAKMLEAIPASKFRRALLSFQTQRPAYWADALLGILNTATAKLCGECVHLLVDGGRADALKSTLVRMISQHTAGSELLLWLARDRSDSFADILGPEVFRAMLTAIERDQFNERKSNHLRDYILDDQELLVQLIESANIEVIKDLTRALQLSPSFDDMDKRSLLARIVKHFPVIQSMITGEHTRQDNSLVVSWPSLERRKLEYDELVQKRIPANSRDIAIARSYGDLSENHEYKAAKEQHRLLMLRKSELEDELARSRGTDFAGARTEVVGIGTRVKVADLGRNRTEEFNILGAWDFDLDRHIISYLSPIAQALFSKPVGEEVRFELNGETNHYRIEAIAVCDPAVLSLAAPPAEAAPAAETSALPTATALPALAPEPAGTVSAVV